MRTLRAPGPRYDVVVVGGGIAGTAMAAILGELGWSVLLVERTRAYADRVRGEALAPWGVAEARTLGLIEDLVEEADGREVPCWDTWSAGALRRREQLAERDPHGCGILAFVHMRAQEALLRRARRHGAVVVRGATARYERMARGGFRVEAGRRSYRVAAVVAADGRSSAARRMLRGPIKRDPCTHHVTGALVRAPALSEDAVATAHVGSGRALLVPLGERLWRLYFMGSCTGADLREPDRHLARILGPASLHLGGSIEPVPGSSPIVSFPNACTWVPRPYGEGLVLIGDAAGVLDPSIGQGLAISLRDVHELRDALAAGLDLDAASERYAAVRGAYFGVHRLVAACSWELDCAASSRSAGRRTDPLAAAERERLMAAIRRDPARVPATEEARRILLGCGSSSGEAAQLRELGFTPATSRL